MKRTLHVPFDTYCGSDGDSNGNGRADSRDSNRSGRRNSNRHHICNSKRTHSLAKSLLALCALGGVTFGGSFAGVGTSFLGAGVQTALAATTSSTGESPRITHFTSGPLQVNGQLWRNVPYFVAENTTFAGIWYLQQLLASYGYTTRWNGHSLFLPSLPDVYPASSTQVNGHSLNVSGSVVYNGQTYIDAANVASALGGSAAFSDAAKTLTVDLSKGSPGANTNGSATSDGSAASSNSVVTNTANTSITSTGSSVGSSDTSNALLNAVQGGSDSGAGLASATSSQVTAEERALMPLNGVVWEGNNLWHTAPIIVYKNTSFFGIWYLQELLREHGIAADWNGTSLSVSGMPTLIQGATVRATVSAASGASTGTSSGSGTSAGTASGTAAGTSTGSATTSLISWNGKTYMPVSILQALGIQADVNDVTHDVSIVMGPNQLQVSGLLKLGDGSASAGDIAFQDFSGNVTVLKSTASGFAGAIPTDGSTVIGVRTDLTGWIGEVLPVSTSNSSNLELTAMQAMTTVKGKVAYAGSSSSSPGASYHATEVSLRNVITHAHYYAPVKADGSFSVSVPVGSYEVFALVASSGDAVFLLQPFLAGPGQTSLTVDAGALPSGSSMSTAHADILTADSDVSAAEMASVAKMFEAVYQETVDSMKITPGQKMEIHLYGSTASYQKHYQAEGYSQTEAQSIAEQSVASEEGSNTINVLMPTFDTVDGLNILAHEFTHALVNKVSTSIDSWANEGTAWTQGVNAETDGSPSTLLKQGVQWNEWVDIVAHQQAGTLVPLGQGSTLNPDYNVEAQDYFAVQQLVAKYGWDKFLAYVSAIDNDANAFKDTFGESFSTFAQDVTNVLAKDAASTDKGITARIRTLPNGPKQVYVINPNGDRYLISGLEPSMTYDLTLHADGSVDVSSGDGLTVTTVSSIPVAISGDWFIGSGADGDGNRQEFDIADEFGLPFLDQAILYGSDGSINHVYPATAVPNGISMVSLTPIQ